MNVFSFPYFSFLSILFFLSACVKAPHFEDGEACANTSFRGVFILNEGNGINGNDATLSFWEEEKKELACQDVFQAVNQKALGSIANAFVRDGDTLYIMMTGSSLVYKLQLPTFQLISETKFPNGFYLQDIERVASDKLYVSGFNVLEKKYTVFVLNPQKMEIVKEIALQRHPYEIAYAEGKAYVACGNYPGQQKNNQLAIINTTTDELEQYISLPKENPTRVLVDKNRLFVLCAGNYVYSDSGCVVSIINRLNLQTEKNVYFHGSAYRLAIAGDYLLGIRDADDANTNLAGTSIFKIDLQTLAVNANFIKDTDFKPRESGDFLYSLNFDKTKGEVYVTFSTSGKGFIVNPFGEKVGEFQTGIYPGNVFFYR
jgi:hypothetical protein